MVGSVLSNFNNTTSQENFAKCFNYKVFLKLLTFQTFLKTEIIENQIIDLLSILKKEELLLLNKVYFYMARVSDDDYVFFDFVRNLDTITGDNQDRKTMLFLNFLDPEQTFIITLRKVLEAFKLSGVRDLMKNKKPQEIVLALFEGKIEMHLTDLYTKAIANNEFLELVNIFFN